MDNLARTGGGPGGAGAIRRRVAAMPCAALALALMAAAFLVGMTGTARADLTVAVGGNFYTLDVLNGDFNDNSATLRNEPWFGDPTLAESVRDAAFAASDTFNNTINGASTDIYAWGTFGVTPASGVQSYNIEFGSKNDDTMSASRTDDFVTATNVTPVPEIDGAVLAQLALVLGTLWLVFGVGRRGDGETPAA